MLPILHLKYLIPLSVVYKFIFLYSMISHSNDTFVFEIFANKHFNTPNLNLVNEPDLTRILQSEIFEHIDGQLQVAHLILEYKPISTSFQAPKYVIKVKDPWLYQINIAIMGFLTCPLPEGTHQIELPSQRSAEEEATSSQLVPKETIKVVEVLDSNEDFEAFDQPRSQESLGDTFSHLPLA